MSILGYSAAYFFPEYWSTTPLYGEKLIPLIDYILSTDYAQADKLANAFYMMENKYKGTADLPIDCIKEIIEESGYTYILNLLGTDEASIRLLVYLLVLIHQLKGSGRGIEVVLNLLKKNTEPMTLNTIGKPTNYNGIVSDFSTADYIFYNGFSVKSDPFEITFPIRTGIIGTDQTVASTKGKHFYLGINNLGNIVLLLGSKDANSWDISDATSGTSVGVLTSNTNYLLKLTYDRYEYTLKVSTDGKKYTDYLVIRDSTPLNIYKGTLYLGVNYTEETASTPFKGSIDLNPFTTEVSNIDIIEWFEEYPLGEENTFRIKADLDLGVVSSDFFQRFAIFVSKYVYPTLRAFEANINLQNNITFLPWVRKRIKYIAEGNV